MEQRLIDANGLLTITYQMQKNWHGFDTLTLYEIRDMIDDSPTIDATPVIHAHWTDATPTGWITPGGDPIVVCSHCGGAKHMGGIESGAPWKYCKDCGAKMDEAKDET